MSDWTEACAADDLDLEDVIEVVVSGHHYAVYRSRDDRYYATDGYCTHEQFPLAAGLVSGSTIECAKHNGRFDYVTGEGLEAPICVNLKTYPVKVEQGTVFIGVG